MLAHTLSANGYFILPVEQQQQQQQVSGGRGGGEEEEGGGGGGGGGGGKSQMKYLTSVNSSCKDEGVRSVFPSD